MKIYTRWMISRDLPQVLEIDSNSYENWYTESELVAALRVRFRIGLVAEFDDTIAGYLLYELHQSFLHVSRLAVDPRFRRKYVATQLINRIKSQTLNNKRRNRVVTSVCEYNVPGQLFLRANAFHCYKTERHSNHDSYGFEFTETQPRPSNAPANIFRR